MLFEKETDDVKYAKKGMTEGLEEVTSMPSSEREMPREEVKRLEVDVECKL